MIAIGSGIGKSCVGAYWAIGDWGTKVMRKMSHSSEVMAEISPVRQRYRLLS